MLGAGYLVAPRARRAPRTTPPKEGFAWHFVEIAVLRWLRQAIGYANPAADDVLAYVLALGRAHESA